MTREFEPLPPACAACVEPKGCFPGPCKLGPFAGMASEPCIDCDATGRYPSGVTCKSCAGRQVVWNDYARPISRCKETCPTNSAGRPEARTSATPVDQLWQDLLDKDDRTSPEEYPDMALITYDEFRDLLLGKPL